MTNILNSFAFALHILSVIVWVGGMFFSYVALRPAAVATLDGPQRLTLWTQTLSIFFPWVFISIVVIITSGLWMILSQNMKLSLYLHIMITLGVIMMLIFAHVYFAAFRRLKQAVAIEDWATGKNKLAQIRKLIAINLSIGFILVIIVIVVKRIA